MVAVHDGTQNEGYPLAQMVLVFFLMCHTQLRLAFFPSSPLGLNVDEVNGAIPDMRSRKTMWVVLKGKGLPPDEGDFFPVKII